MADVGYFRPIGFLAFLDLFELFELFELLGALEASWSFLELFRPYKAFHSPFMDVIRPF